MQRFVLGVVALVLIASHAAAQYSFVDLSLNCVIRSEQGTNFETPEIYTAGRSRYSYNIGPISLDSPISPSAHSSLDFTLNYAEGMMGISGMLATGGGSPAEGYATASSSLSFSFYLDGPRTVLFSPDCVIEGDANITFEIRQGTATVFATTNPVGVEWSSALPSGSYRLLMNSSITSNSSAEISSMFRATAPSPGISGVLLSLCVVGAPRRSRECHKPRSNL